MSACYSIELDIEVRDFKQLKEILNSYDIYQNKKLNLYQKLEYIFAQSKNVSEVTNNNIFIYSDFNASYGWENVMLNVFLKISDALKDNSKLIIYIENDYDELYIKNGKVVQAH
ncbi:hypothetical protein [Thomasclavelia spiroformis]|uniref:hypothetical protein n=1 Tax=Thomasclavelia spiroformis TaxID=29348 RepID=UPI0024B1A721|nr:hypothetical protein [Thomasclavelia spiroformis]